MTQATPPVWLEIPPLSDYQAAVADMQGHAHAIASGHASEAVFFTEHSPVYTGGTSARPEELLNPRATPVVRTNRGGQWTWHGPGQLILWPVLDLNTRRRDVRAYIHALEGWMIDLLACFTVTAERRTGLPGIWVRRRDRGTAAQMDKIAAVGVRISKWVTMHGLALNIDPDLGCFGGIVPCGVTDGGVTSLADMGQIITREEVIMAAQDSFNNWFGPGTVMGQR